MSFKYKINNSVYFKEELLRHPRRYYKAKIQGVSKDGNYYLIENNRFLGIKEEKELYSSLEEIKLQ